MPTVQENRTFLDLVQGKKFNSTQREVVRTAIKANLNSSQLKQIANADFSKEHMEEMISFFKHATYKDNKLLYQMFLDTNINAKVLEQINKSLNDKQTEDTILKFVKPDTYSVEQMNELRLFSKYEDSPLEYQEYIFDKEKSFEVMQSIREACNMQIPFNEISAFNFKSELYPMMIKAVINGILPNEVDIILEVTNKPKEFDAIVSGYLLGLDDDEIKCCLTGDERHLTFYLELMSEVHDEKYMNKVMQIEELDRRRLIDYFETEENFKSYLQEIFDLNKLDNFDQVDAFLSECGKFNEISIFKEHDYINNYVQKVCNNDKKAAKLCLKSFLIDYVSTSYHVEKFEENREMISIILTDLLKKRYENLYQQKETLHYFLADINDIEKLLNNRVGDIKQNDEFLSFSITDNFEVTLKEYKDYFDIENVTLKYGDMHSCIISKKELEEMVIEYRQLKVNNHGRLSSLEKGRDI